jgi:hypothetical protein
MKSSYPALSGALWQLQTLFFMLLLGCSSPPPTSELARQLPPGLYVFDCPIVYKRGLARLEPHPRGARVQLLEGVKGSFELELLEGNRLRIRKAEMDYPGLKRSFEGTGVLTQAGHGAGQAESWIMNFSIAGRDHRTGPWELRPATEAEIKKHESKERALEERKRRAGLTE